MAHALGGAHMLQRRIKPILSLCASLAVLAGLTGSCMAQGRQPEVRTDAEPTAGAAVASDHHAATDAAWAVLRQGGRAVDAAVAAAFVMTVVMPEAASLAGAGAALRYEADGGHVTAYVGAEIAGAAASAAWLAKKPEGGVARIKGGRAVGAPTLMQMIGRLRSAGGRAPWSLLTARAEALARTGVELSGASAAALARATLPAHGGAVKIFGPGGDDAAKPGAVIRNPALADVLKAIGDDGASVLSGGIVGQSIVESIANATRLPAVLALDELGAADAVVEPPTCIAFGDHAICAPPPPTLGPTSLQTIGIFARAIPKAPTPLAWAHTLSQSHRLAMSDARRYLADPAVFPNLFTTLLQPAQLARRAERIEPNRDRGVPGSSRIRGVPRGLDAARPHVPPPPTASVVVVDGDGDAVVLSLTLRRPFGAGIAARGVLLNAGNTGFEPVPERTGFRVANQIAPGKRARLDLTPIMALDRQRRLVLAAAAAGGPNAPAYLAKAAVLSLAFGKSAAEAVGAPNIASAARETRLELRTAAERLEPALADLGHRTKVREMPSGLTLIRRGPDGLDAAADPRGYGAAISEPAPAAPATPGALDSNKRGS